MEAHNPSLFRRLLGYISKVFKAFKLMLSIIFFAIFAHELRLCFLSLSHDNDEGAEDMREG